MNQTFAHSLNPSLSTERLLLEPLISQHAFSLYSVLSDVRIYQWIESGKPPPSLEWLETQWKELESRMSPDGQCARLNWALKVKNTGSYVGKFDVEVNESRVATNVGFVLTPTAWGKGYATEALRAITSHLKEHEVNRFHATVARGNLASVRVLLKSQFQFLGAYPHEKETDEYVLNLGVDVPE
jgi:ribosomal-protein-alanine N-acetyltransferase